MCRDFNCVKRFYILPFNTLNFETSIIDEIPVWFRVIRSLRKNRRLWRTYELPKPKFRDGIHFQYTSLLLLNFSVHKDLFDAIKYGTLWWVVTFPRSIFIHVVELTRSSFNPTHPLFFRSKFPKLTN